MNIALSLEAGCRRPGISLWGCLTQVKRPLRWKDRADTGREFPMQTAFKLVQ